MSKDEEFSAYVAARGVTLVRSAIMMGCPVHDAEDLAQAALIRCYVAWDKVRSARDPDAYVFRVMLNTHSTRRRRMWHRERPTPAGKMPNPMLTESVDRADIAISVLAAVNRLPYDQRVVVTLRYMADLSEQLIAEVLSVPVGTVKSRLSRAHGRLGQDPALMELQGNGGNNDG